MRIIRRPGERYCKDCTQEKMEPEEKNLKRWHCWAFIGWNMKSDLIFYMVKGNSNGKMSQEMYIDILGSTAAQFYPCTRSPSFQYALNLHPPLG